MLMSRPCLIAIPQVLVNYDKCASSSERSQLDVSLFCNILPVQMRIDAGQDDISVLNMESILLLDRWKVIDLEFVQAAHSDLSAD